MKGDIKSSDVLSSPSVSLVVNWACDTLFWPTVFESLLKTIAVPRPFWRFPDGLLLHNSKTFHETLFVLGAFLWINNGGDVCDIIDVCGQLISAPVKVILLFIELPAILQLFDPHTAPSPLSKPIFSLNGKGSILPIIELHVILPDVLIFPVSLFILALFPK